MSKLYCVCGAPWDFETQECSRTNVCIQNRLQSDPLSDAPKPLSPELQSIADERGKVYGDPFLSHTNIGLCWTGLIQQHYGITLPYPIPGSLAAQMLVGFKNQRSVRVLKKDNNDDLQVYQSFSVDFQKREGRI